MSSKFHASLCAVLALVGVVASSHPAEAHGWRGRGPGWVRPAAVFRPRVLMRPFFRPVVIGPFVRPVLVAPAVQPVLVAPVVQPVLVAPVVQPVVVTPASQS